MIRDEHVQKIKQSSNQLKSEPILELVLRRIQLRAKRRIAWLRKLWQEEGDSGGQLAVTHAEIDTYLENRDSQKAEFAWYASDDNANQLNQELVKIEAKIAAEKNSRFAKLHQTFELNQEESDLFQLCLAIKLDPSLARIYAYLHDHAARGYATEELALRLFGYGHNSLLKTDSSLLRWKFITEKEAAPGEPSLLKCDPFIAQWLLGHEGMDESLTAIAMYYLPKPPLKNWPVKSTTDYLKRMLKEKTKRVRFSIVGPPGCGRRTFAAIICSKFKMRLFTIDSDLAENWYPVFVHAQRQALLDNCGIAWYGEKALRQTWSQRILNVPLQFMICEKSEKPIPGNGLIDSTIKMPEFSISEQQGLLKRFIPVSQTWNKEELNNLVAQHRMNIGDISALVERDVQLLSEASDVIRESARYKLGKLAQLLECPFEWDDLVLPKFLTEVLTDFVFEARERKQFWEKENARRLFPQGRGLIALFSGPSGTGKTMAAQVIAADLGLDLFRIDLSAVVSKYVGETSQNLERILSRAEHLDIVLLFDEADALFGKRTEVKDAHDRFANTDTNYLLQAIENYGGIALLSSNKKENIDTAFIRRLRYVLEFPKPDAKQRKLIWTKVAGKLIKRKHLGKLKRDLAILANDVEMTGAQIKFVILSSLFIAKQDNKPLAMKHMMRGLDRELMKEGRTLSGRERERLINHGK